MSQTPPAMERAAGPSAAETFRQDENARARASALSGPRATPPASVPGYEILRCLGTGAYGSVWLAAEQNTGKQVAIKFYEHRRGLDWSLLSREVEKLALLYTSRDIVGLQQVGWDADPPYYVMEYLERGSLARLLDEGALPVTDAARIATAVTNALVHAHHQGILHCDVKPANVLLDGDLAPRLADFGQARLSHEQSPALGTLFYMAPEQADLGAIPDPRWDVYALGALFYHMLTGEPPFKSAENERRINGAVSLEEKLATYRRIVESGPRPAKHRSTSGVDARLAEIVDRCLAPDPSRRFANAAAVAKALELREEYRTLRPKIVLGIVLPGLLMLALFPLAVGAVRNAVETAEKNIAARALESELVAAKILSYSLKDDLDQRIRTAQQIADDPEFIDLLPGAEQPADSPERLQMNKWLETEKKKIDEIRENSGADLDESWFLTDAHGFQRWRHPASSASLDRNWGWRDYFHGQGEDRRDWQGRTDISPLTAPHISAPFRSTTTGGLKVAISVPVRAREGGPVLGVLSRTINLGELLTSYKKLVEDAEREQTGERLIALVDVRSGMLLDHPWMTRPENREKLVDDDAFSGLLLRDEEWKQLDKLRTVVREKKPVSGEQFDVKYFDPIQKVDDEARGDYGMAWLAAFWPVGDTGWIAVVQERRDEALHPVREIQAGLVKYALIGLVLCLTFVATSWYFVRRMRSQVFRVPRRPGDGGASGSMSASSAEMHS